MSFADEKINNGLKIVIDGDIDLDNSEELRAHSMGQLSNNNVLHFDMSKVGYIDSSGVSVLIELHQYADEEDKEFVISNPSDQVTSVLEMAKLLDFFNISK